MKACVYCVSALLAAFAVAPQPALACSEGMYNTGKGLAYQGYLAPRPATVLVYDGPAAGASQVERQKLYKGLQTAGHTLVVVKDHDALASALREKRFDVVITAFDTATTIADDSAQWGSQRLLPIVPRTQRNSPALRDRFELFLVDGASLGQYLRTINRALTATAR